MSSDTGKRFLYDGVLLRCDKGVVPTPLTVLPRPSRIRGHFQANQRDAVPLVNLKPFGVCAVTQSPCMPLLPLWGEVHSGALLVSNAAPLLETSTCYCARGGRITPLMAPKLPAVNIPGLEPLPGNQLYGPEPVAPPAPSAGDAMAHEVAGGFKWAALGLGVLGVGLAIAGVFFPPLELAAAGSFEAAAAASAGTVLLAADVSLAIGVSLDVAVYEVHPTPANQAVVVGDAIGLALGYGAGKLIGAAVSKYGPAVAELFAQRAAQKALQEIPEELPPTTYSTISRVQGGVMPNASRFRIGIGEGGEMVVDGRQMLHVTFDEAEHTAYFLAKRGPEAEIISFKVETKFVEQVKAAAVPQAQARNFPGSPQIDDPTVTTGAYGLPKDWIDKMVDASVKGSGKITK